MRRSATLQAMVPMPALDGVDHKFVDVGGGVTIHVADAGPVDGPPVMLVHGFPENWWEWHELIGPLAADGYRVLCPDLRGAGWSSAPRSRYLKNEMADDLAATECMRQPGHAVAGSRWYRSFQTTESMRWMRGEFDNTQVDVPVRWLSGT